MGNFQSLSGQVTCPVCGREVLAETELPWPMMHADVPSSLTVGDSLGEVSVSSYDIGLVQRRQRTDPQAGLVIVHWSCPVCEMAHRWATVGLGPKGKDHVVRSLEARPISAATVDASDWIHPGVIVILFGDGPYDVRLPLRGRLTADQLEILRGLADAPWP